MQDTFLVAAKQRVLTDFFMIKIKIRINLLGFFFAVMSIYSLGITLTKKVNWFQ